MPQLHLVHLLHDPKLQNATHFVSLFSVMFELGETDNAWIEGAIGSVFQQLIYKGMIIDTLQDETEASRQK